MGYSFNVYKFICINLFASLIYSCSVKTLPSTSISTNTTKAISRLGEAVTVVVLGINTETVTSISKCQANEIRTGCSGITQIDPEIGGGTSEHVFLSNIDAYGDDDNGCICSATVYSSLTTEIIMLTSMCNAICFKAGDM